MGTLNLNISIPEGFLFLHFLKRKKKNQKPKQNTTGISCILGARVSPIYLVSVRLLSFVQSEKRPLLSSL